MKFLFFIALQCCTLLVAGQSITFENTWKKGSNTVYAGLVNELILVGNIQEIKDIKCSAGTITRKGDTLLLKNNSLGPFTIAVEKEQGIDSFSMTTELLPSPVLSLTNVLFYEHTEVEKSKILEIASLTISGKGRSNENLYENYDLVYYEVSFNNQTFKVTQKNFTPELHAAINELPAGKTISVNNVSMINKETGKKLSINCHKVFKLL